jgi:hypothetical protein
LKGKEKKLDALMITKSKLVESQRDDTSIPFPKPPLPNIRGSINCTIKIHGPKLKFLKTKEIRQNTKIMGTNQNSWRGT